jgi:PTS system cellobiose-specific IIA component
MDNKSKLLKSKDEKKQYIISKAMDIIMNSGDARNFAAQAMNEIADNNFDKAREFIKKAEKVQTKAHVTQTEMIQGDIRGGDEAMEYSVLFAHAQDTLMTIQVEINITKSMINLAENVDKRITAVEKG